MDVFFAPSPASRSRLGLIVGKHGRDIVDRNRVKRRLREIGRRTILGVLDGMGRPTDVLIRARWQAYEVGIEELRRDVGEAMEVLCSDAS